MNKIDKMAQTDAFNWARAEMFFGEGAGTRRKLLDAEINQKMSTIPDYIERFNSAYSAQDFADHAIKAAKERQRIDAAAKAGKNFRALKAGNIRGLSNGVFVVVAVGYGLHVTGYDKVLIAESKKQYKKAKAHFAGTTNVYNVYRDPA